MKTIQGDLLEIERGIILHQVNAMKVCGGLAGALNRRFPRAFKIYFQDERSTIERAGTCLIGWQTGDLRIAHIFGQMTPGPCTEMGLVEKAIFDLMRQLKGTAACDIYAPHSMGCGLGGGNWPEYSAMLERYLPEIIIVQKYK